MNKPVRLGNHLVFANGKTSPLRNGDGNYTVWGSNGPIGYSNDRNVEGPFIVIGRVGAYCGSLYFAKEDGWVTDNAIVCKAMDGKLNRFWFYALQTASLNRLSGGSGQPLLNQRILREISLGLPDPGQWLSVAGVLGALDDLIDTNERLARSVADQAKETWRLVVKAETVTETSVAQLATVILGGTPARNRNDYWGGDVPWLNSGKANEFRVIAPSDWITRSGYENSSTKMMPAGTTLIAITGATLGQVTRLEFDACGNQSLVGVYTVGDTALNDHLYYAIRDRLHILVGSATGGAQQHINKSNVEALSVLAPDDEVLARWEWVARPLLDATRELLMEARQLREARDQLLPLLLSGRVRVDEVVR